MGAFRALACRQSVWVGVAVLIRLAFVFFLGERTYQADETGYDKLASTLAQTGVLGKGSGPEVTSPGAPVIYAAAYAAFGHHLSAARAFGAVLSGATAWLIGQTAKELTGSKRVGLIALAAAAVYPFFVYYSGLIMSETPYLFFTATATWLLVRAIKTGGDSWKTMAAAGVALAAASLTRTEAAALAVGLFLCLGGLALAGRFRGPALAAAVLAWSLPLGLWAQRNHGVIGVRTLDIHGGITLLDGIVFFDLNEIDTTFSRQALRNSEIGRRAEGLSELEKDRLFRDHAIAFIRNDPKTFLRQCLHKSFNFWRLYPRLDKEYPDTATARPDAGLGRRAMAAISLFSESTLLLLGAIGAWRLRARWQESLPLYGAVLGTFLVHAIIISQMRYRLPVMPAMIVFAAFGLHRLLDDAGFREAV